MTPLDCAQDIAAFLKAKLIQYEGQDEKSKKPVLCFTGFLPRTNDPRIKEKLCPAVVVGYGGIADREDETVVSVVISVVTRDEDMIHGAVSLFHLLEFIRYQLLTNNPVCMKYNIKNGTMETSVPDDQPYPQWWGRIDVEIHLPQPQREIPFILGGDGQDERQIKAGKNTDFCRPKL